MGTRRGLGAVAKTRQIDGVNMETRRQVAGHTGPVVLVRAEAVQQHDWHAVPAAEVEHAQTPAAGIDVARREGAVFRRFRHLRLGRDESGDKGVPIVHADPQGSIARAFTSAAEKLAAQISIRNLVAQPNAV